MTRSNLIWLAGGGSIALLAGAFAFEYLGELAPCKLCIWQRWPHAVAGLLIVPALLVRQALFPLMGALAALTTAAVALYHTGVERSWWEGPTTCSSGSIDGLTPEDLLNQILGAPLVQCDQVAWEMLGLSMASWNGLASLALAGIWLLAAQKST